MTVKFQGADVMVSGYFPTVGSVAPKFELTGAGLDTITNDTYKGKNIVLNIFPSLDTPVCAASVRKFNEAASKHPDTVVLCASMDLPFAMSRFCTTEGLKNVVPASAFRSGEFGSDYGVAIADGPLRGLLARAVVVINKEGKVAYAQLVDEITNEPDYEHALAAL